MKKGHTGVFMRPSSIEKEAEKTTLTYPDGSKKILTRDSVRYVPAADHVTRNEVLTEVMDKLVSQTEKGVKKYGDTVDPDEYSTIQWINHAIEESIDHIVYLTVLKKKLLGKGEETE